MIGLESLIRAAVCTRYDGRGRSKRSPVPDEGVCSSAEREDGQQGNRGQKRREVKELPRRKPETKAEDTKRRATKKENDGRQGTEDKWQK